MYVSGTATLHRVLLSDCASADAAALGVYTGAQVTAAFLHIAQPCTPGAPSPALIDAPPDTLVLRALTVDAPGCPLPLRVPTDLPPCGTPAAALPLWLPLGKDRHVCGPGAKCTQAAAAADGSPLTTPTCSCEGGQLPSPLVADASLAPYNLTSTGGCISPLVVTELSRLDRQTRVALFTFARTLIADAPSQEANLTLSVDGTLWNLKDEGVNASYPWAVANATPVHWLSVLNASGTVDAPAANVLGASATVPIRVSAAGLASGDYESSVDVTVLLPTLDSPTRTVPQNITLNVRALVTAPAVARRCTRDAGCQPERGPPSPVPVVLDAPALLEFTACDIEGLPTSDPASFTAELAKCTGGSACRRVATPPIKYLGGSRYAAQLTITRAMGLGSYHATVTLDGQPLNFTMVPVAVSCPRGEVSNYDAFGFNGQSKVSMMTFIAKDVGGMMTGELNCNVTVNEERLLSLIQRAAAVTAPSALAGKRSNHRARSWSPQPRPSTPHCVTSCHWIFSWAHVAKRR